MPFTTPRELAILQDLATTLRSMTVAGGYGWDVKASSVVLDPDNIFDVPETALPFFIVEPSDGGTRQFQPALQLYDIFLAVITARVDATGADPSRRYTIGSQLAADLEKVLTVDLERSGLSADTRLRQPQIFTSMSGEQPVIVVQRVETRIYRTFGAPA